jgi:ATP-dependent Clp protease adaptor protein ClpS
MQSDRPTIQPTSGTATIASPGTGTRSAGEDQITPLYHVVLLDDDEHTYDYVIEMLVNLFFVSPEVGYRHAVEVDATGRTVVITCELAQAEFGRDQIHGYGADPRMAVSRGSMRAVVEPAASPA